MEQKQKTSLLGTLLVLLAGISWGTSGIFVRYFTAWDLSTMQQTFFKVAVAGTLMLLYCLLFDRSALKIRLKDLWVFLGAGVISLTFFTWCYFSTIQATSMSTAAILLYLAPTLVMLMSSVLFKEQITKQKVVACILAFAGCVFVSGIIGNATPLPLRALVTGLLSALGYALYSIFGQLALNKGYGPMTISTYAFLFATVTALPFLHPAQVAVTASEASPLKFFGMLALMSVTVSLAPYLLYTNGLKRTTPGNASITASIEPVTATVLGALLFRELPDLFGYIGIALVLSAILLLNIKKPSSK
ncbi:MAG: EamA family transporter [Bacteroidales bacterium]|nr:EamA family transporter [Clostridia bacterium]MBR1699565.1 EamA family transporter [Bacteroidales bacterium]